jgi:hypothetical protein
MKLSLSTAYFTVTQLVTKALDITSSGPSPVRGRIRAVSPGRAGASLFLASSPAASSRVAESPPVFRISHCTCSAVTVGIAAIFQSNLGDGPRLPFSHADMSECLTPSIAAKARWVLPMSPSPCLIVFSSRPSSAVHRTFCGFWEGRRVEATELFRLTFLVTFG